MLSTPEVDQIDDVVRTLRTWQVDGAPVHLHPGDLGWHRRFGARALAESIRVWTHEDQVVALGLIDTPSLIRLAVAPRAQHDSALADEMRDDLDRPERGVLPAGEVSVEARSAPRLAEALRAAGWDLGEPWTPLTRNLGEPVDDPGLRIEVVDHDLAALRVAVHRASFGGTSFTETGRQAMTDGVAYTDARCLLAFDGDGAAVAAATVWSAGPDRPGLLEPLGVHRDHRGRGHGRAISLAAAAALRDRGSSSAIVCTPASNVGAVATYRAAGFRRHPDVCDLTRPALP